MKKIISNFKNGDEIIVSTFLLLPKTLKNSQGLLETRWLEHAKYITKFNTLKSSFYWYDLRWATKEDESSKQFIH